MTQRFDAPYEKETFPGGLKYLRKKYETRLFPFNGVDEFLPASDCDLEFFKETPVALTPTGQRPPPQTIARKTYDQSKEFDGQPELLLLHAVLIAISRHDTPPPAALALFQRIWREEHAWMIEHVTIRWKVSALKTFAEYGATEADRKAAAMLVVLLSTMQLYESERLWSGTRPITLFDWSKRLQQKVVLGLHGYPLKSGDMDRNLLMTIWNAAEDTSTGPKELMGSLLTLLNRDRRTIFRRIRRYKAQEGAVE